jgi:hypothetical protein
LAKGLKPIEKADDLKKDDGAGGKDREEKEEEEPDPFLTEAQYILLDLITMSKGKLAKH